MNILCDILVGLITGCISGMLVYIMTTRREYKYQTYRFWENYLLDAFKYCEMYIPAEALNNMSIVGGKDSKWNTAIFEILDDTRPFPAEDRELTEKEIRLSNNLRIALKELNAWAIKNHLHTKNKK